MEKNRFKILSGSALKVIAVITMLIDHTTASVLYKYAFVDTLLFSIGTTKVTVYFLLRSIGRLAFPIFCFLLIEGFLHTRDRKKYGKNLLIFALISEIPWNLINSCELFFNEQNVFFTLFFGYMGIFFLEKYKNQSVKQAIAVFGLFFVSVVFKADYGYIGYIFIILLYSLRNNKVEQAIVGSFFLSSGWRAGLAFIPINMYNGERGFIKSKRMKYAFYAFYPVHLLILFFVDQFTMILMYARR